MRFAGLSTRSAGFLGEPASAVVAAADRRGVAVARDATNNVFITGQVTGDIHVSAPDDTRRTLSPLHQLPADVPDFAGRRAQVDELLRLLEAPSGRVAISAIDGMGGLGKTALAVHVGHRLTERYPDGQIVVDMGGTTAAPLSPAQALARVIGAFAPQMRLPEAVAELRPIYLSVLRGKRVLVILDNAVDGDQAAPLVPPEACALIVTSAADRGCRHGAGGPRPADLGRGSASARDRRAGRATDAELAAIAALCGLLPLALRVAGMFLVASLHWPAAKFIAALSDERKRLAALQLEGAAALDVAASLALSVRELRRTRPEIADRWHELAVFPADFDTAAAAAVWTCRSSGGHRARSAARRAAWCCTTPRSSAGGCTT